jgi:hypothetical protein
MLKNRLQLQAGVVAATVTLPNGSDEVIAEWAKENGAGGQSAILFGSSDMLLMSPEVYEFDRSRNEKKIGRTVNNYHAAILRDLHWNGEPRLFRALSFLRAQRPEYERLSLEQLEQLIEEFEVICTRHDVACRVLLGYGWADLYLYFSSEELDRLFSAVVACRTVSLKTGGAGVFRNAFTIVGIDVDRQTKATVATELVRPKISLRVEPSELRDLIENRLPGQFPSEEWKVTVTSGKRDIFIIPHESIPFGTFWDAHSQWRRQIGLPNSPIYKMETHFDFAPSVVLPDNSATGRSTPCQCQESASALEEAFLIAVRECKSMGPGLARSFDGLARLYLEALDDADSCCDFDAAAAHYFGQRRLFREYQDLCEQAQKTIGDDSAEALRIRRRRDLIRDVLDRLEISSVFIFHQEQNGSYADLLSRSERVSLYRGGMQKINSVLLMAIDSLIERYDLPLCPMLCWWPAGQIQSERPIGVIKVPVYFLHQPEVALFLIIHELGQLAAYEYYRKLDIPPVARITRQFSELDAQMLRDAAIQDPRVQMPREGANPTLDQLGIPGPSSESRGMIWFSGQAERFRIDTGKLITDMWADVFLLRVGFSHDTNGLLNFLFEQFLSLLILEKETASSTVRIVQFVARLITVLAVEHRLAREENPGNSDITEAEINRARHGAMLYLDDAFRFPRFAEQIAEEEKNLQAGQAAPVSLVDKFLDESVVGKAADIAFGYRSYLTDVMAYTAKYNVEPDTPPADLNDLKQGVLAQIDPSRIPSYFRAYLALGRIGSTTKPNEQRTPEEIEENRRLFLARSALVSSILASYDRKPRLPIAKNGL